MLGTKLNNKMDRLTNTKAALLVKWNSRLQMQGNPFLTQFFSWKNLISFLMFPWLSSTGTNSQCTKLAPPTREAGNKKALTEIKPSRSVQKLQCFFRLKVLSFNCKFKKVQDYCTNGPSMSSKQRRGRKRTSKQKTFLQKRKSNITNKKLCSLTLDAQEGKCSNH